MTSSTPESFSLTASHADESFPPLQDDGRPKADFTIFVHVFYPDIWEEMRREIERAVLQPFALVITRPASVPEVILPDTPWLRYSHQYEIENRGRDILPFLRALKEPGIPETEIGLKLHTKRSPHRNDGDDWRRFICASLLERAADGRLLGHRLLASEHRVGIVAPEAHLMPLDGRISINDGTITDMLTALYGRDGVDTIKMNRFAAGSMFWFRRLALSPLLETPTDALFAPERGQLDGTAAHALERLFGTIGEQGGFLSAAMENAVAVLEAPPETLSDAQLAELIDRTLVRQNPFSLPLRDFWRKSPRLLKLAHIVYARLPKGLIRVLRAAMRR